MHPSAQAILTAHHYRSPSRMAPKFSAPLPTAAAARFAQPPQRSRDGRRGFASAAILATLLFGLGGGGYSLRQQMDSNRAALAAAKIAEIAQTAGALRVGPIIFMPPHGDECRRRLIDNATGKISDGGVVSCGDAGMWNQEAAQAQYNVGLRIDIMRASFRAKGSSAD